MLLTEILLTSLRRKHMAVETARLETPLYETDATIICQYYFDNCVSTLLNQYKFKQFKCSMPCRPLGRPQMYSYNYNTIWVNMMLWTKGKFIKAQTQLNVQ